MLTTYTVYIITYIATCYIPFIKIIIIGHYNYEVSIFNVTRNVTRPTHSVNAFNCALRLQPAGPFQTIVDYRLATKYHFSISISKHISFHT